MMPSELKENGGKMKVYTEIITWWRMKQESVIGFFAPGIMQMSGLRGIYMDFLLNKDGIRRTTGNK